MCAHRQATEVAACTGLLSVYFRILLVLSKLSAHYRGERMTHMHSHFTRDRFLFVSCDKKLYMYQRRRLNDAARHRLLSLFFFLFFVLPLPHTTTEQREFFFCSPPFFFLLSFQLVLCSVYLNHIVQYCRCMCLKRYFVASHGSLLVAWFQTMSFSLCKNASRVEVPGSANPSIVVHEVAPTRGVQQVLSTGL